MSLYRTCINTLEKFGPTKRLLNFARRKYEEHRYNRFDTCSPDTIGALKTAFERTKDLKGDYYEFGMYKGYLFYKARQFAKANGQTTMHFYGFDSFAGLPETEGIDTDGKFTAGMYAYPRHLVEKHLRSKGVLDERTTLIEGFYDQTLTDPAVLEKHDFKPVAVALIDCDLYSSTKDVLNFLASRLQEGTVLVFDDWNCFDARDDRGQRKAMAELLAERPELSLEDLGSFGWHGNFMQVHINS